MSEDWVTVGAQEIRVGDVVRLNSGVELLVSRIDYPFLGRTELLKVVESTDERWLAHGVRTNTEVQVKRSS